MDRVYLDANALFSAAYLPDAPLARLWKAARVELLTSPYALDEALENLKRYGEAHVQRLGALVQGLVLVKDDLAGDLPEGIRLPDKDRPVLLAAIQAKATHFLTSDRRHFGPYLGKKIGGVKVMLSGAYLRQIESK